MSELSIRKRGDKWEYRFEGAKIDGKRKQISKGGFLRKGDAAQAGAKALSEYNNAGLHFTPSDLSVSDYLDYWFDTYGKMNLSYNTQLTYMNIIEKYLKPKFGQYKLKALNTSVIQEYVNNLKRQGLKRSTVVGVNTTLSGALNYAIEPLKYIQFNPCDRVKYPKFTERKGEDRYVITVELYNQIINRFEKAPHFYIPIMIGYHTGLRIGEVFGLSWDDIDFDNKTLTVNKQIIKRNYGVDVRQVYKKKGKKEEKSAWYISGCKTGSSYRTIRIGDTLLNELKKYKELQEYNRNEYGEYYTEHYLKPEIDEKGNEIKRIIPVEKTVGCALPKIDLITVKENGEYISTDSFKYASRVIHQEITTEFNFHSLRHTHATMIMEKMGERGIKSVQQRLGHNNISTTLQTYVHDTDELQDDIVNMFDCLD